MIPGAYEQGTGGSYYVREDVVRVEVTAIWQESLHDFAADCKSCGACEEGEVDDSAAGGFQYPVEGQLQSPVISLLEQAKDQATA